MTRPGRTTEGPRVRKLGVTPIFASPQDAAVADATFWKSRPSPGNPGTRLELKCGSVRVLMNHDATQHPAPSRLPKAGEPSGHAAHDHASMMANPSMAQDMERDIKRRFLVALVLTVPVAALAG